MKDFAGSSITYYDLAREKVMNKYPRLISVLMILALICMTGLAIFLISDLVSFASNTDHTGSENGIVSTTDGKEKSGNIGLNSSTALDNSSRQTKEPNFANLSQMNASLPSSQAARGVIAAGKSSSSSSLNSADEKSGNSPAKRHHSSSSSSSAKSAKKSNNTNNLTQEVSSSKNKSEIANATGSGIDLLPVDTAKNLTANSSNLSNDSEVELTVIPASLSSVAIGGIANPTGDASARVPEATIQFKTNADNQANADGATVSDTNAPQDSGAWKAARSVDNAKENPSRVKTSSQAKKAQETRDKQIANRDRMVENMKKKAAQSRAKAAERDNQANANGATVSDTNAPQDSGGLESSPIVDNAKENPSRVKTSSQAKKAQETRDKQIANRDRMVENMKKKAAQSRAKAAERAK